MSLSLVYKFLKEIWTFRYLLFQLTLRELKVRYKQTFLGISWAICQPLVLMLIFTFVFRSILKTPTISDVPYSIFSYAGLLPWVYFSSFITLGVPSLTNNSNLISKVYFPRELIPLSVLLTTIVDFLIASSVFCILLIYYRIWPSIEWLWLLPIFGFQSLFGFGIVLFFSALHVKYRDIRYVIPLVLQGWMFITPIFYPAELVPSSIRFIYMLNPMAYFIDAYHHVIFQGVFLVDIHFFFTGIVALIIFMLSFFYFKKVERWFAEVI